MAKQKTKLPSTAVGRRRLLKLADMLEADAENAKGMKFDISHWGSTQDEPDAQGMVPVSCNTTACACGLAAMSGAFKSEGLGYRLRPRLKGYEVEITLNGKLPFHPRFDGSYVNIMKFFEVTNDVGKWLFTPMPYVDAGLPTYGAEGERVVAKRIRDFVAGTDGPTH